MQVKCRNFVIYRLLFSLKFVGTVFVSLLHNLALASINSSHVITESSIILAKYLPFVQLHIA